MIPVVLAWQSAIWFAVSYLFGRSRLASIFHPFAYYLAFHGIVFVIRPIMEYTFGFEGMFYLMRFYPNESQFITTAVLTTVGMVVFGLVSWLLVPVVPRFDRLVSKGFTVIEWQAFAILSILLGPLALYSAYTFLHATGAGTFGGDEILMDRDPVTGVIGFSNTTGYFVDAQLLLGPFFLMLIWGARFRPWSFVPLLIYIADRAYIGWGRWTIILTAAMVGLLFIFDRGRRWIPAGFLIVGLPVFLLFQQLGDNRDAIKELVTGEASETDSVLASLTWIERQDSPDFANFDFLTYVMDVVPEKSGTYSYFTQYTQLLTEPIPRILWPDKPYGPPILLVNLNAYGNFVGWTPSLLGDGWISGGWLGAILTMAMVGYICARMHRWFWSGDASAFKVLVYCSFLPITVQWFRDGGISIAKFVFVTIGPLFLWRFIANLLRTHGAANSRVSRFVLRPLRPIAVDHPSSPPTDSN
jgi:hypothetical protein